jgi:hypothetical protein
LGQAAVLEWQVVLELVGVLLVVQLVFELGFWVRQLLIQVLGRFPHLSRVVLEGLLIKTVVKVVSNVLAVLPRSVRHGLDLVEYVWNLNLSIGKVLFNKICGRSCLKVGRGSACLCIWSRLAPRMPQLGPAWPKPGNMGMLPI